MDASIVACVAVGGESLVLSLPARASFEEYLEMFSLEFQQTVFAFACSESTQAKKEERRTKKE